MRRIPSILAHLARSREEFIKTTESFLNEQWRIAPCEGVWSAAEVVAHVSMVERSVVQFASKIAQKAPKITPFWKHFHVPVAFAAWRGAKRKSPIPLDPTLIVSRDEALQNLAACRKETLAFIESTRERDLSAYRFDHPFLGSLNIYEWLRMIGYHDVRHAKQLREIVQTFRH